MTTFLKFVAGVRTQFQLLKTLDIFLSIEFAMSAVRILFTTSRKLRIYFDRLTVEGPYIETPYFLAEL